MPSTDEAGLDQNRNPGSLIQYPTLVSGSQSLELSLLPLCSQEALDWSLRWVSDPGRLMWDTGI